MLITTSLDCTCIQVTGDTQEAHDSHKQIREKDSVAQEKYLVN